MKEQVIFVLSQNGKGDAVDELLRIAREEPDPELRTSAIFWLGQSKDPRIIDFLEELIGE